MTAESLATRSILIVEDDEATAVALRDGLSSEGYQVHLVGDGASALDCVSQEKIDLIVLDVMLPKVSGLDVCRRLRAKGNPIPIIMLTARGQEIDKVVGLKLGADDYVTKPFSFMELFARVEALLRRSQNGEDDVDTCEFADVFVDFTRSEAKKADEAIELSPLEFRLLRYFHENRGRVISREELLQNVWGYRNVSNTRTVDMHIAKLRKKIEDEPKDPRFIGTVHRVGYKFTV